MTNKNQILTWILENKQVGNTCHHEINGETLWSSVAIQKWGNAFKVYVDEIYESQMSAEAYLREEIVVFEDIEKAIDFVSNSTLVKIKDVAPCKGQKIFNPQHA